MTLSIVTSVNTSTSGASLAATFTGYTPQLNDLVILFPSSTSGATNISGSTPSGWVNPLGAGVDVKSSANEASVGYHFVTSAEVAAVTTTYTATSWFGSSVAVGIIGVVVRGVDTTTPIDSITTTFDNGSTTTPHVMPALVGANLGTGSEVLGYVCTPGTKTYATAPTGWTFVVKNTSGQSGRALCSDNTLTTAGTGVSAANITPSSGGQYIGITIALTPLGAALTASSTDNIGITDSLALGPAPGLGADPEGITDSLTTNTDYVQTPSDSEGLTDSSTMTNGFVRSQSDPVGATDTLTATQDFTRSASDNIGLTDAVGTAVDYSLTPGGLPLTLPFTLGAPGEQVGLTDNVDVTLATDYVAGDAVGVIDSLTTEIDYAAAFTDPVGISDTLAAAQDFTRETSDTVGATDAAATAVETDTADLIALADVLDVAADYQQSWTDPVGVADSATFAITAAGQLTTSEPVGLTDNVETGADYTRGFTYPVGATDDLAVELGRALADPVGIGDSLQLRIDYAVTATDNLGLTDSLSAGANAVHADETIGLSDTAKVAVFAPPDADNTWVVRTESAFTVSGAETNTFAVLEGAAAASSAESNTHVLASETNRLEVT